MSIASETSEPLVAIQQEEGLAARFDQNLQLHPLGTEEVVVRRLCRQFTTNLDRRSDFDARETQEADTSTEVIRNVLVFQKDAHSRVRCINHRDHQKRTPFEALSIDRQGRPELSVEEATGHEGGLLFQSKSEELKPTIGCSPHFDYECRIALKLACG